MLYWFRLNHLSPKVNWYTNKSEVKYLSLNTLECNTRCATGGVLGSQVQFSLEVTFLLNLFCSPLRKSLLPPLPESPILGKTRMHSSIWEKVVCILLFAPWIDYNISFTCIRTPTSRLHLYTNITFSGWEFWEI